MDVCMGGSLCVLWVAGGIVFSIFKEAPECQEDLLLSILARRSHKELRLREHAIPEEGRRSS